MEIHFNSESPGEQVNLLTSTSTQSHSYSYSQEEIIFTSNCTQSQQGNIPYGFNLNKSHNRGSFDYHISTESQ